jgi:hypothetical protein
LILLALITFQGEEVDPTVIEELADFLLGREHGVDLFGGRFDEDGQPPWFVDEVFSVVD